VNAKLSKSLPPLLGAVIKSNTGDKASLAAVQSLLEHNADANVVGVSGETPFYIADNPAVVTLLISHGANTNAKTKSGLTPLNASICPSVEKANQLIAGHANVNFADDNGNAPLHMAASCGSLPVVKTLVEHGAQVNVKNRLGKTPLDQSIGHQEIIAYLKTHGATGEIPALPVRLPSLFEVRKDPAYNAAFLAIISGRLDVPSWIRESGFQGVRPG